MAHHRDERLQRIEWRYKSLTTLDRLPPVIVLKDFIGELQQDIRDEALDQMSQCNYTTAVTFLNHGINISGLLRRDGLSCYTTTDAELLILRSQCANKLGYSQAAIQDAEDALHIDGYSISANVELVKAKYAFAYAEGPQSLAEFQEYLLYQVPQKVKENSEMGNILRQFESPLDSTASMAPTIQGETTANQVAVSPETRASNWTPFHKENIAEKWENSDNSCRPKEREQLECTTVDAQAISQNSQTNKLSQVAPLTPATHSLRLLPSTPHQLPLSGPPAVSPPQSHSLLSTPSASTLSSPSDCSPPSPQSSQSLGLAPGARGITNPPNNLTTGLPILTTDESAVSMADSSSVGSAEVSNSPQGIVSDCTEDSNAFTLVVKKNNNSSRKKSVNISRSSLPIDNIPSFYLRLRYTCGVCFASNAGETVGPRGGSDLAVCAGSGAHDWLRGRVVVVKSRKKKSWCKVKPRHSALRRDVCAKMCPSGDACSRPGCMFPHINEEILLWNYMRKHNIKTLNDVLLLQQTSVGTARKMSTSSTSSTSSKSSVVDPAAAKSKTKIQTPLPAPQKNTLTSSISTKTPGSQKGTLPVAPKSPAIPQSLPSQKPKVSSPTGAVPKRRETPTDTERGPATTSSSPPVPPTSRVFQSPSREAALENISPVIPSTTPGFRHPIKYVCGICFQRHGGSKVVGQRPGNGKLKVCAGTGSHAWKQCKMVVMYSNTKKGWCQVKPRHHKLWPKVHPMLCNRGEDCPLSECKFPHIQEEIYLWVYMADHSLKTLDEVVLIWQKSLEYSKTKAGVSEPSTPDKSDSSEDYPHACSYCDTSYPEQCQLQQHIQTNEHWSKVNSDEDKKDHWKHRSPPWNVVNGQYQECLENKKERCVFTDCTKAHSDEELEEWKERHRYRMMKMKKAKECKLYAFMDDVFEKYNFSTRGADVIAEELPGVQVSCSNELTQCLVTEGKNSDLATYTWTFTFKASDTKSLRRVCLFYDDNRLYFRLSQPARESEAQVCPGNLIVEEDRRTYRIDVMFRSQILGCFSQWVLFDLGTEPYLVRKLQVQVGSAAQNETLNETREELRKPMVVWNNSDSDIVRFADENHQLPSNEEVGLLSRYRVPAALGIDDLEEMSRNNYKEFMHRMLYLEEQECNRKISKFNSYSTIKCLDTLYVETSTGTVAKYSVDGSKYGMIDMKTALMDDSDTSQIIERSVRKMMLKFDNSEKIYEASILQDQDETGKHIQETLYVKLSQTCVGERKLQNGNVYQVEIQLQLNRLHFCYMHSAVQRLQNMDMVFPPIGKPQQLPLLQVKTKDERNPHQNQAVMFISAHEGRNARQMTGAGPLLVLGPFGTGKTHTLATAVQRTLQLRPDSKILICTQTNSAADLYITEHLHRLVEKGSIKKMVRVYARIRNIKSIGDIVRRYVSIENFNIQIPTTKEIKECSIVITTLSTSHRLDSSKLYGHFTHILIDEAGQALEAEALQPLTLATESTCVVLAGDHLQMNPKVFSRTARQAKFHISLLERLFYLKASKVMLSSNYRTCQKMLNFISEAFYYTNRSSQILEAVGSHEQHPGFKHPLVFCTVKGVDQKIGMSYVNHYEVEQVSVIVKDLYHSWPEEKWGKLDNRSIGVITPYTTQVGQIRKELRKVRLGNITVDRIHGVQGQQYRVLIISPVRTRSTINKADTTAVVSKISPANRPDDTFDYGFLSDPRLLNAACTRAQSLLIVVGDPATLCSVGDCSKIWRKYLKECEDNNTLFPLGTTVVEIQHEVEAAKQRLDPCAPVFEPAESCTSALSVTVGVNYNEPPLVAKASVLPEVDSWLPEEDDTIPDGILRELERQISEDRSILEDIGASPEVDAAHDAYSQKKSPPKSRRKAHKYRMVEKDDRIILEFNYEEKSKEVRGKNKVEEFDLKNDEHNERERKQSYELVKKQPDKYKICSFHCEESGQTYAVPLEEGSAGRISITSRRRRGRALNLDEVIVEIFDDIDESEVAENERKKCYGKVICICKRAARSALMTEIVCRLDEHKDNLMIPIDRTLPKLYVWSLDQEKSGMKSNKRASPDFSSVSVYHYVDPDDYMPFLHNVKVPRKDRKHKLFIVRYRKWFAALPYPLGAVTEVLPLGDDREKGLRILKLMHGVRDIWRPSVIEKVNEQFPSDWAIPEQEIKKRYDARNQIAFTIDPPDSQDLDDALSVELVGGNYQVGVHISDVSYFVSKGTEIDQEANKRATSFYPPLDRPVNMLPERISNELCSLLPDQDRLAITIRATLDQKGSVVGEVKLMQSVVRSCRRLTYNDAEKVISSFNNNGRISLDTLDEKIYALSNLANARREMRLGVGRFAFSHNTDEDEVQNPLAHSLVEEMMLLANQAVGIYLVKAYPDCSPLRRQLPPSDENVNDWLGTHGKDVTNSLDLQSKNLPVGDLDNIQNPSEMTVLKEKWNQLRTATASDSAHDQITRITDLITSDENHPQLAAAKTNYFRIQERTSYISTGEHPDKSKRGHHSLNMSAYTHFSSPIRRYFDLVVHRMLIAAINDEKVRGTLHQSERPYTNVEIAAVAHHCNYQNSNSRAFEKKTFALQYALRLREGPRSFVAFVSEISDSNLDLLYPYRRFLPSRSPLNLLKPTSRPKISEDSVTMELNWKERVYELHSPGAMARQIPVASHPRETVCTLYSETAVIKISAEDWQEILNGVQAQNMYVISRAVMDADLIQQRTKEQKQQERKRRRKHNIIEEVTCETSDTQRPLPFVNFKRNFGRGEVVQVQLNASIQMGVLMPSPQLFCLTPKLNLCTEHRADAIECFAQVATHCPPARMKSIDRYQAVWLPILKMLSAYGAVLSDEASVLHGVDIEWKCSQEQDDQPVTFSGTFELMKMFCHHRNVKLRTGDYLCIRYKDIPLTPKTKHSFLELGNTPTSSSSFTRDTDKTTFVAHTVVSEIEDINKWTDEWKMKVKVLMNQHSAPFPGVLLEKKKIPTCTIEIIPKSSSDRRLESALMNLDKAEQLTNDICLHNKPKVGNRDIVTKLLLALGGQIRSFVIQNSPFPVPNRPQQAALRLALQQQFTIIQGPPGTGKTITGAHLTFFFTEVNKKLPNSGRGPPQVLYCGPSNKSVDVVAHYILRLGIPAVRVYNHLVQQQDFPVPGHTYGSSKVGNSQEAKMDHDLRKISLHHLIRQKTNSHSQLIRSYDQKFQTPNCKISFSELLMYKKAIYGAEEEELRKYKVVLCTCNEAGSGRIQNCVNVIQCIIDEAGMCNEPETLIPLVGSEKELDHPGAVLKKVRHSPLQVVLIGDHKQLRPIIQERTAVELGMEISLLEKYGEEATMLTIQYRMHESICAFPSETFYKGKLETAATVKRRTPRLGMIWPGGIENPLVFCHHVGAEDVQSVRTEDGNEQSRANPKEVQQVVRIASAMVNRLRVQQDSLVVLTQYRLQRALIEKGLTDAGLQNITVSTVITSQGREWDYVILSTVRSLPKVEIDEKPSPSWKKRNMGFICDENQMNVALTRSRMGLIVIGNEFLLKVDKTWALLLTHYHEKGAVVYAENFLKA